MSNSSQYLDYLKIEKGLSENTINVYQRDLEEWEKFLGRSRFSIRAVKVKRKHVRSFLFSLAEKNNQPITRRRKLTSIKNYFTFLENENLISSSPVKNISMPRVKEKEPSHLTEQELKKLIKIVERDKTKYQKRNELMLKILVETGVRLAELTGLNTGDINVKEKTIMVRRKGGKEQSLPINSELNRLLRNFIKTKKSEEPLFISSFKRRITNRRVGLLFQGLLKKAGISKPNISVHSTRHSFCTRLLEKGMNLKTIQILAGHKNISTTERYLHIANRELRAGMKIAEVL